MQCHWIVKQATTFIHRDYGDRLLNATKIHKHIKCCCRCCVCTHNKCVLSVIFMCSFICIKYWLFQLVQPKWRSNAAARETYMSYIFKHTFFECLALHTDPAMCVVYMHVSNFFLVPTTLDASHRKKSVALLLACIRSRISLSSRKRCVWHSSQVTTTTTATTTKTTF